VRKIERKIKDHKLVEALLQRAEYIHLAMWDGTSPYVVPMSFGYKDGILYFHSSYDGKKAACLKNCERVSFDAVVEYEVSRKPTACGYTAHFKSVVGAGRVSFVQDPAEKARALDIIMAHYGGPTGKYEEKVLEVTCVVRIDVDELVGKSNPPWQGDEVLDVVDSVGGSGGENLSSAN
jgi:uncharacterized protein